LNAAIALCWSVWAIGDAIDMGSVPPAQFPLPALAEWCIRASDRQTAELPDIDSRHGRFSSDQTPLDLLHPANPDNAVHYL
jgi:hypothetical protein